MKRTTLALGLVLIACSTRSAPITTGERPRPERLDLDRTIRVALPAENARLSATRDFTWHESSAGPISGHGKAGEEWRVDIGEDAHIRRTGPDGKGLLSRGLVLRPSPGGFVTINGRRYRGELRFTLGSPGTVLIVNHLRLEDYLGSVVAMEMGNRPGSDSSALQAQAVASRSYAFVRLGIRDDFDVRATVVDQVYGGADAENPHASAAVEATRGLVLRYQGRVVDALYSSTCGGSTAEPNEIWRSGSVPYLQRVSDRVGNSTRYYCDAAPRYRWTRVFAKTELQAALNQYLKSYTQVPEGGPGSARHVAVVSNTPSGRVGALEFETDRGAYSLQGNDIRYVLRAPGGEILSSTYFSVEPEYGRDGLITRVTFRGRGYGHGVGMCQWGAIGRARAGQSFRSILGTYYPGTTVGVPPIQ